MKKLHVYGFTLIELMATIAIAALVMALAVPSFRGAIQNNKFIANSNQLAAAFKYARTEAIKRRAQVTICGLNEDKDGCSGATNWTTNGFAAFDGTNIIKVWVEPTQYSDLTMTSSSASLAYDSSGMLNGGAAIGVRVAFTDVDDNRCVEISTTGRVNTRTINSGDSCP